MNLSKAIEEYEEITTENAAFKLPEIEGRFRSPEQNYEKEQKFSNIRRASLLAHDTSTIS